jgi:hypothetical protein
MTDPIPMYQYLFNKERPEEDESWDLHLPLNHPFVKHLMECEFPGEIDPDPVLIIIFKKGNPNPSFITMQTDKDTFSGIVMHPKYYESAWYLTTYGLGLADLAQAVQDNDPKIYQI